MSKHTFFITGIGTDVGKTIVSAIVTEALQADYWKPIQAGDLNNSDTDTVKRLVSNTKTQFHNSAFNLQTPMSPHAAAEIDNVSITSRKIISPKTNNHLVIEGAGGLLVPINDSETILDIIKPEYKVIVVSRHYLGSINHTLLTIDKLKQAGKNIYGIVFNGEAHLSTESVITKMTGVNILTRINHLDVINSQIVQDLAKNNYDNFKFLTK